MLSGLIRYLQSGSALWFFGQSNFHMQRRLAGQALILASNPIGYLSALLLVLQKLLKQQDRPLEIIREG